MRTKFWLIQRGSFTTNLLKSDKLLGSSINGALVQGDYMGSAEFEFGAIPKAYRRIMGQFEKYSLHVTDLKTNRGIPFCLYCRDDRYNEILEAIRIYLKEGYQLQEWSNMDAHFKLPTDEWSKECGKYNLRTNFWWCIDKADIDDSKKDNFCYNGIGDWIAFTGATDRQNAFKRVIQSDYTEWWCKKSIEDREKEFNDSIRL